MRRGRHGDGERRRPRAELPEPVFAAVVGAAVCAAALFAVMASGFVEAVGDDPGRLATFVAAAVVLQFVAVEIYGRGAVSFASTGMLAAGFAVHPGAAMAIAAVAAATRFAARGGWLHRAVFDAANLALAAGLASLVFSLGHRHGDVPAVGASLAAGAVFYTLNVALLTLAMSLSERTSPWPVWRERFKWMLPYGVAAGPLAGGLVLAYDRIGPAGVAVFAVPPAFMMLSARQYLTRTREGVEEIRRINEELSEANRRLAASEEHFRSLIEDASDAIAVVDPAGLLRYASPALERMLGLRLGELLGTPALPEAVVAARASLVRLSTDDAPLELRLQRDDGQRITVELTVRPLREDGEEPSVVMTLRDVTARKAAEEALARSEQQLLHAQKLEALGRLAGGIAHDFNNLLTVIVGCSELLRMRLPEDDPRRVDAEEIARAGASASGLTRQLLAFSSKQVLEPRVLDLKRVVLNLQSMLARLVGSKVALVTEVGGDAAPVLADSGQLEQVVVNLVVNACDAIDRSGRIAVGIEEVGPDAVPPADLERGRYAVLTVSDTGRGMDEATRARIFEPFFTTKGAGGGTGLGLATVYGIVAQSGGGIDVESAPGEGTTFRIWFPRHDGPIAPDDEEAAGDGGSREAVVLLVEDEDAVRRYATTVLEEHGHRVLGARDGSEALALSRALDRAIDLLLTDVAMPGVSGPEVARTLAGERPEMRVLFMSAHVADGAWDEVGETPLLAKPFRAAELLAAVEGVLAAPAGVSY